MRPAETIENKIKNLHFRAKDEVHNRILEDALNAMKQSQKTIANRKS